MKLRKFSLPKLPFTKLDYRDLSGGEWNHFSCDTCDKSWPDVIGLYMTFALFASKASPVPDFDHYDT
jgi:hypothetical protein